MTRRKTYPKGGMSMGQALFVGVALILAAWFVFGGPAQQLWNAWAPTDVRQRPDDVPDTAKVVTTLYVSVDTLPDQTAATTTVWIFDENQNYIDSAATSSGVATISSQFWEGETIYIQCRVAAPNAAAYAVYTTPMKSYTVPTPDANSKAYLDKIFVYKTSTSAATFSVVDLSNNAISDNTAHYVNTTDTQLSVTIRITSDTAYGTPEDFTDQQTGKHYLSGAWLVIKSTAAQPTMRNYVANFYSSSLQFYIYRIPMIIYDADNGYQTVHSIDVGDGSTAFAASATFSFDIYDTCWANSIADINENSFMNGDSDLNPTAITSKVA